MAEPYHDRLGAARPGMSESFLKNAARTVTFDVGQAQAALISAGDAKRIRRAVLAGRIQPDMVAWHVISCSNLSKPKPPMAMADRTRLRRLISTGEHCAYDRVDEVVAALGALRAAERPSLLQRLAAWVTRTRRPADSRGRA